MKPSKLVIAAILLAVSGIIIGGIGGYWLGSRPHARSQRSYKDRVYQRLVDELKLTPEQQKQVKPVLYNGFERIKQRRITHVNEIIELISRNYDDIKPLLTKTQQEKMETMRKDILVRLKKKSEEKI
ncbi:MAG: hypothetical protein WC071_14405 [Victivallaceae bacterium]